MRVAFIIECHPMAVESLLGAEGENIEDLEHTLSRAIYARANFDFAFEEYIITPTTIEEADKRHMGFRRSQVLECQVRRSYTEGASKYICWTDHGYYINLLDKVEDLGHRVKVCLQDIRRSYALGEAILPGPSQLRHPHSKT